MNAKQRRLILEVQPFIWILAAILLLSLLALVRHSDPKYTPELLSDGWNLCGESVEKLPEHDIRPANETSSLTRILDERFSISRAICFYSEYEDVTVLLDDTVIYSLKGPGENALIKAAPSLWNIAILPGNSAGKTLTINLTCPYAVYSNRIGAIRFGTFAQVSSYVSRMTLPKLLMAVGIFFIAVVFAIIAIYMRYHIAGNTGMYSLSITLLILAIFLAFNQATVLLNLFSISSYVAIQCISLMLCPILYTRYLARTHTGVLKWISMILNIVCIANPVIVFILQLFHVADVPEMMAPTRALCMITIVYIFILEMLSHRRAVVILFAVGMVYGMWHYFINATITWLMYPAIFCYIYILGYRLINTVLRSMLREVQLRTELEVSKSELATVQITSHFFYHTLDSIRALIRIDADKAYKMTGNFAKYLRYRTDGIERMEEKVSFSRELRSIRAYTDIKQAQLGRRFTMEYDIEAEDFEILPLTIQPLVENAVIHAVQLRKENGFVKLICREEKNSYHIEVIDNGTGEHPASAGTEKKADSTAISNVNKRLAWYGIAPVTMKENEFGGMTVSLDTPKLLKRKGN